jgi:hypothetical protein
MTPIKFTIKDGVTHFHYKTSDIFPFVRQGVKHGNMGMILIKRKGKLLTFKGFGTFENPWRRITTLQLYHIDVLDGDMPTDEQRLIEPVWDTSKVSHSFILLDYDS